MNLKKRIGNKKTVAIIVSAGQSSRMKKNFSKQFIMIAQMPLLAHTLIAFDKAKTVDEVIIVAKESDVILVNDLLKEFKIKKVSSIIKGGNTRQESVYLGIEASPSDTDFILVHDGARPFILPEKIDEIVLYSFKNSSTIFAIEIFDAIRFAKRNEKNEIIKSEVLKKEIVRIQTPQVFPSNLIKLAHLRARGEGFFASDDSELIENIGEKINIIAGSNLNIKITCQADILLAEAIFFTIKNLK